MLTKHISNIFLVLIIFTTIGNAQKKEKRVKLDSVSYYTDIISNALKQSKEFPDKSYKQIKKSYKYFKKNGDEKKVFQCLLNMSDLKKEKEKFGRAFDHLWEALYIIKTTNNSSYKATVHRKLSNLYDIFNKDEESLYHLERALHFSKEVLFQNNQNAQPLNTNYLNLATRQRKSGNYQKALSYLDSCVFTEKLVKNNSYILSNIELERGYLMLKTGNIKEAYKLLYNSKSKLTKDDLNLKIRAFYYLGELKSIDKQLDSSIYYYEKSLNLIDSLNLNKATTSIILSQLSKAYIKKNKTKKAYNYLVRKNELTDNALKSKNNAFSELIEIKNTHLESLLEKENLINKQDIVIKKSKQTQFRLKIILLLVFILGIVLFWVSRIRLKLKKSLLDKAETELNSQLEKEKSEEAIKLKSKELTSYALQLIDKDSAIDELLRILKEKSPSSYKSLNSKYKKGAKDLWDEFNLRFTEVNSDFYNRLKLKHPNLTVTEQKHSALIKLKFSTKEMARILNIEPHSVNISRSRIRKKLGLERSDSLEDYITNL
ncbi:hypothetical protein [Lutibacter citreus]|uniref:hypothetical protein n=1 Tax=Lutibacter citreus TaxID=2138210 RepID=UPI000DBE0902|nr:hypothetical protein [Lutibacter citreus]